MNSIPFKKVIRRPEGKLMIFSQSSYTMVSKLPLSPMKPLQYLMMVSTINVYILTAKNCIIISWRTLMKPFKILNPKNIKHMFMIPIVFLSMSKFFILSFKSSLKNGVANVIPKNVSYNIRSMSERQQKNEIRYKNTERGDVKYLVFMCS